jgi:hypothetical protein
MAARVLTILEISQKQAYIFASNKLMDNVAGSAIIEKVMKPEYYEGEYFDEGKNFVYSGGGHSVLEFPTHEQATAFARWVTRKVYKDYPELELFVKTIPYDEKKKPGQNIQTLTEKLERKKALRRSTFRQGSFGVEERKPSKRKLPKNALEEEKKMTPVKYQSVDETDHDASAASATSAVPVADPEKKEKYRLAYEFKDLGGSKGESNFIAVVHIDGNAMGKRLELFNKEYDQADWDTYKNQLRAFSDSIDKDFKDSYEEMTRHVAWNLGNSKLTKLSLKEDFFPVRRIITAGDDVCFVSEGRIGVECAVAFIKALSKKKNSVDGQGYAACAGVAIVHQKYPFYRAYELAELLCSNAKKFGVSLKEDGSVSAIDWHIEYGEQRDTLEDTRRQYDTADGKRLELRPYIVEASEDVLQREPFRQYASFKKLITNLCSRRLDYARGKIKEMRGILKQGEDATTYYVRFNQIEDILLESYYDVFGKADLSKVGTGVSQSKKIFAETADGAKRSILFDAIELMDTFIELEGI